MFILRFRQADIVATVLSPPVSNNTGDIFLPVSLLPEAWNRWKSKASLITGDNDTGDTL